VYVKNGAVIDEFVVCERVGRQGRRAGDILCTGAANYAVYWTDFADLLDEWSPKSNKRSVFLAR
jgi:hypothetical protein